MHQFKPQVSYGSYGTEPSSPHDPTSDTMQYYSAPSSPIRRIGSATFSYESDMQDTNEDTNSHFFEFTKFEGLCNDSVFEEDLKYEPIRRVDSLPTMAFADELFFNGQVKPLKLPPRLQYGKTCPSPAMSPTSVINISFTRKNIWNDEFDPFMVALDKVREEYRGRKSVHRRSQSHSPFRPTSCEWPTDTGRSNEDSQQQQHEKFGPLEHGLAKSKGSAYSRWARRGTIEDKKLSLRVTSPKAPSKLKGLSFRKKARSPKMGHEESIKPTMMECKNSDENEGSSIGDKNKMEKVKGILKRYASLRKEQSEKKVLKKSFNLKNLSSKFRGNSHDSGQKKVSKESKMVIVPFKPRKLTLCLGYYGGDSPSPRA